MRSLHPSLLLNIEASCPDYQRLLHVYSEKGEDDIVSEVLATDLVNVNAINDEGLTALQAEYSDVETVEPRGAAGLQIFGHFSKQ